MTNITNITSITAARSNSTSELAICAIFNNEGLYLKEWIEFHLLVGVKKFYLYNNSSTDNFMEVLAPYIESGIVDLTDWSIPKPCQLSAYQNLFQRLYGQKLWVAFIDCDEFLFSPTWNLTELLGQINRPLAIGVNWVCFGSSGKDTYEAGLVIERFTWRPEKSIDANTHIKSIIRMDQQIMLGQDPHYFWVPAGTFNELGETITGPFSRHSTDFIRINHYCTKSKEEWLIRTAKGKADRVSFPLDWKYFNQYQALDVDDRIIQQILPELKLKLV